MSAESLLHNGTETSPLSTLYEDPFPFEDFAPTLAQCFFIVIAGYLAAKLELLCAGELRGVNAFAGYFAMPGIICVSLADADLRDLRWQLLAGLLVGKALVFVAVAGLALACRSGVGVAGLLAVFCVHSNDLPVGNPLITALYRDVRPDMTKYLFFMPALTMIFLVPLGNTMVENHEALTSEKPDASRHKENSNCNLLHVQFEAKEERSWTRRLFFFKKRAAKASLASLAKSPVILSTVAGIVMNLAFKAKIPGVLHQPINVLAATIPGLALSILGFNMVGKERYLVSSAMVLAVVLIAVKVVVTPLLLHSSVRALSGSDHTSKHLSDFALLYGIISPSTAVFQTGQEFRKPLAAMSAALIVSSFACFPLSYAVARITVTPTHDFHFYLPQLREILFYTAGVSLACNILVWASFLWKKEFRKVPCCYVAVLSLTQFVTCCGIVLWYLSDVGERWTFYCRTALFYGGETSGHLWTGVLAVVFVLQGKRPDLARNRFAPLSLAALGLSALITTLMCWLVSFDGSQKVFFFGMPTSNFEFLQLLTSTILLGLSSITVGVCILLHCRRKSVPDVSDENREKLGHDNHCIYYMSNDANGEFFEKGSEACAPSTDALFSEEEEIDFYYRDVLRTRNKDAGLAFGRKWTFRLFGLLVFLWVAMATKLIANLFKLVHGRSMEIMLPLEYLQASLFVGQGVFIWLTFGIDVRTWITSFIKWYRKLKYGKEEFEPPNLEQKSEISIFCNQFLVYYYSRCVSSLAKERRWKKQFYKDCFWGHQLVDWLIEERLCGDEVEAQEFGRKLLLGGVVRHVRGAHHFHDAPYLYHFVRCRGGPASGS